MYYRVGSSTDLEGFFPRFRVRCDVKKHLTALTTGSSSWYTGLDKTMSFVIFLISCQVVSNTVSNVYWPLPVNIVGWRTAHNVTICYRDDLSSNYYSYVAA